ncbi:hypothetical protein ACLMAB_20605 [Brevibacillus laterosporus]
MEKIKVLLADDHRIVREGVKMILQMAGKFEIIGKQLMGMNCIVKHWIANRT